MLKHPPCLITADDCADFGRKRRGHRFHHTALAAAGYTNLAEVLPTNCSCGPSQPP